jgi:Arc/MetJ-type ribon-helix-helix transcriptional regulator
MCCSTRQKIALARVARCCCRSDDLWFKYQEFACLSVAVFDKDPKRRPVPPRGPGPVPDETEDARIALRCNRSELRLVDSFVASGEYASRSELMRSALHAFLRSRSQSAAPSPPVDAEGLVEVPVRLRPHEYAVFEAYARDVMNGVAVRDVLAAIIRHGESEMKVREHAERARASVREAVESRAQAGALQESAKDLERKGVVGR